MRDFHENLFLSALNSNPPASVRLLSLENTLSLTDESLGVNTTNFDLIRAIRGLKEMKEGISVLPWGKERSNLKWTHADGGKRRQKKWVVGNIFDWRALFFWQKPHQNFHLFWCQTFFTDLREFSIYFWKTIFILSLDWFITKVIGICSLTI